MRHPDIRTVPAYHRRDFACLEPPDSNTKPVVRVLQSPPSMRVFSVVLSVGLVAGLALALIRREPVKIETPEASAAAAHPTAPVEQQAAGLL
jgi:hypothetical protein